MFSWGKLFRYTYNDNLLEGNINGNFTGEGFVPFA